MIKEKPTSVPITTTYQTVESHTAERGGKATASTALDHLCEPLSYRNAAKSISAEALAKSKYNVLKGLYGRLSQTFNSEASPSLIEVDRPSPYSIAATLLCATLLGGFVGYRSYKKKLDILLRLNPIISTEATKAHNTSHMHHSNVKIPQNGPHALKTLLPSTPVNHYYFKRTPIIYSLLKLSKFRRLSAVATNISDFKLGKRETIVKESNEYIAAASIETSISGLGTHESYRDKRSAEIDSAKHASHLRISTTPDTSLGYQKRAVLTKSALEADSDDEEEFLKYEDIQISQLFSKWELFKLFAFPAILICSTLTIIWEIFKYVCSIHDGAHFMKVVRWLLGRGPMPT